MSAETIGRLTVKKGEAVYNVVVIGAGTAGLVTAAGTAGLGGRVALIEKNLMGGDCLNFGCVPSKAMLRAAKAAHEVRTSSQFGIVGGEKLSPDFTLAMERVHRIRGDISRHDAALRFKEELGVDVFFGVARFAGENSIYAGEKLLHFKKAAICTGARAAAPPIPGIEESGYLTNETVFSQKECPQRLAVIGGGPIGCELAQAFARLGSKVTLIEQGKRLLPREDPD